MAEPKDNREQQLSADLLGYHLGIADEETRARVEAAFEGPEALASARAAVQKFLAPLDADEAPAPPPDLVANVLDRVEEAKNILPMRSRQSAQPRPVLPAASDRGTRGGPLLSMRDLVGLAAAILIFVGIFMPGYHTARMSAQRMACANNLRMVGNGYASYAETYGSHWPYAGVVPADAAWTLTDNSGVPRISNSRHVYRLVRGRLTPPEAFNCPGREGDVALQPGSVQCFDDFPDARNNSYTTNFVTRPWKQREFTEEMPIAADMTPLVNQRRRLVPRAEVSMNSPSHGRLRGQNVLRGNISVRFFRRPDVGIENDDIYRIVGVEEYTGLERPRLRSDAFLIP